MTQLFEVNLHSPFYILYFFLDGLFPSLILFILLKTTFFRLQIIGRDSGSNYDPRVTVCVVAPDPLAN